MQKYFNPRAPCGARQKLRETLEQLQSISIHAPRVGRDPGVWDGKTLNLTFQSTRPVWGATNAASIATAPMQFQSTRPVWGATASIQSSQKIRQYFNPRAPCGARPPRDMMHRPIIHFNPRAPCGARQQNGRVIATTYEFQSTRPVWGATAKEVTTSPFCHVFMGIPLHKYDFLGT